MTDNVSGADPAFVNDAQEVVAASGFNQGERAQHTPGPWRFYDDSRNPNQMCSIVAFGKTVAHVYLTKGDEGEDAANARLLAAAPDLLEALSACFQYLDRNYHGHTIGLAQAAIDKALGK